MGKQLTQKAKKHLAGRVRLVIAVVIIVGALFTAGVSIYYLVYVVKPQSQVSKEYNQFTQQINTLEREPVPDDPVQRAVYYAQLGQNYENLGNYDEALDNYLKAQKTVDDNKLSSQIVYYQAIANTYQQKNDHPNARKYLELQKAYLNDFLKTHPGDAATKDALKEIDRRLGEL